MFVDIGIGTWRGKTDFTIAPMDDFKIVLGMELWCKVNAIISPCFKTICLLGEGTSCSVSTTTMPATSPHPQLSAMQLVKGRKKGEPT